MLSDKEQMRLAKQVIDETEHLPLAPVSCSVRHAFWQKSKKKRVVVEVLNHHPKYPYATLINHHGWHKVVPTNQLTEIEEAPNDRS